jgi:hypothetical protein
MALHSFTLRRDIGPTPDVVEAFLESFEVYLNANNSANTTQLAVNRGRLGTAGDGKLGATAGVEATDPLLLPLTGSPYVYLPGQAANRLSIPNGAAVNLTGNVTLRVAFAPTLAVTTATEIMMKGSSWTAPGLNYGIGISATGQAVLKVTDSANNLRTWTSSAPAWTGNDGLVMVEAALNVTTAVATFRTKVVTDIGAVSDECAADTGWVALGAANGAVSGTVTGAALVVNGDALVANTVTATGKLYYADVRNAAGLIVTSFNPSVATSANATSWVAEEGQTVSVVRNSTGIKLALIIDSAVWLFDGTDYIEIPDQSDNSLDLGSTDEMTVFVVVREHAHPTTHAHSDRLPQRSAGAHRCRFDRHQRPHR